MHLRCLEPLRKMNPAISKLVQRGKIISDVDNAVYEVKTFTSDTSMSGHTQNPNLLVYQ